MAKVTMPQLGESVAEGTIGKWLKQPGDHVAKYEPLVEVVTDKVNAEVPSPFEGILREILVEEGATVPNNAEIAVIETADDGAGDAAAAAPAEPPRRRPSLQRPRPSPRRRGRARAGARHRRRVTRADAGAWPRVPPAVTSAARPRWRRPPPQPPSAPPAVADPDARMTPAVRRLLREHDLSAAQIQGTGGGGRITREDVLKVVETIRTGGAAPAPAGGTGRPGGNGSAGPASAPAAPRAPAPVAPAGAPIEFPEGADEVLLPMTQMRKGIAAQMTRALAVPHAYVHMEVDASALVRARETAKRDYQAREGISLSYVPFVIKAVVDALRHYPDLQRPLDRRRAARQAPHPHGRRRRRRRRAPRAGRPRRGPAVDQRPEPGHLRGRRRAPARASSSSTTTAGARSPSTTPAGSART